MRVRRAPISDVLDHDDEKLVLTEGRLYRLAHVGAVIFELCHEPRSTSELASQLEEIFGRPPEGTVLEATDRVVTTLVAEGLLTWVDDDG
jgi:hypothetical protein